MPNVLGGVSMKKSVLALLLIGVMAFAVVASGCIGGGGQTTPTSTPTSSESPTQTQVTKAIHKTVLYVINDDAIARINLFQTGTVDAVAIPPERINDVKGLTFQGYNSVVKTDILQPILTFIVFNTQREPFNNPKVREALAYAIPYDQISQNVYSGNLERNWGPIPKPWPGYTEYGITKYDYNIEKAKKMLQEAGVDPSKYKIELIYNAGNSAREKIMTILQNVWSQLGFQITVSSYEWPVYLGKTEKGDYDVYVVGWVPDYLDSDNWVGPFLYGATNFKELNVKVDATADDISSMMSKAEVIETDDGVIVVGPKGSGASVSLPSGKKVIAVSYVVDEENTPSVKELMEQGQGFGAINPAFFRDTNVDALVIAARRETAPEVRTELFKALYIKGNQLVPEVILGQNRQMRVYWDWVKGRYYHPTFAERYDLLWEDPKAPSVDVGIKDYKNDPNTYVIGTIGWPESFDPAMTYETFGWEIWHEIGDTLVTYWKEETEKVTPDLAVAWAHNEDGTEWYFVIRGGVKAYDPWNDKTYPIDATDVAFTFWRVKRLGHSVSWMTGFMDLDKSQPLTEQEFENVLKSEKLIADYNGKSIEVKSMKDLLDLFGYSGETAGVYKLVLPDPYAPILGVVADPFLSVLPAEYLLGDKYDEAMKAADNGKNPSAWEAYVQEGEQDPTHQLMHKYPVGTGPYYVKEYEENSYIVLALNPYYWNKDLWEKEYGYKP